ncbi:MAG TPA: cation diffusion facilitator family transporter [Acidisoma sp.]|uniref:cation diffusion facilitator family transporter n=1 Tax=Acidisoma sp. TaxID=1872115 RepID=UPI002C2B9068|nr:cation diffusion facilitator family transporter [Acidisoma sp.]HTI02133.1 cation diffusion facilitator family transporter [Acidisoma sp.]
MEDFALTNLASDLRPPALRLAAGSIVVGLVVLALKGAAWWITGSAALYSDALETVVNVVTAAVAFWTLRIAARPADHDHPYGHDKAEFFSAVVEAVLILVAAASILHHVWLNFQIGTVLRTPLTGMGVNLVATVINGAWAWFLLGQGRAMRSPALTADAKHLGTDVITSSGILVGLLLVVATGVLWLDSALAALTAVYILWTGIQMLRQSLSGLMDAAPDADTLQRIRHTVSQHAEGALEAHDLRTRQAGRLTFLQFHLVVPGGMTVEEAHNICDRIEEALKAEMEGLVVTIHVEPERKAKHTGVIVL